MSYELLMISFLGLLASPVSLTPASPYKFAWLRWYLDDSWWRILWRGAITGLIACVVAENNEGDLVMSYFV